MKRLCVFAHWDRDNIIDEYVIYYLKALREVCQTIIFVSDSDLEPSELTKLDRIADYKIAQRHGEYDFGSYKRGFLLAKEKALDFDELIFANDSCYGPFFPLKPIFDKMATQKCDFWGMTEWEYTPVQRDGIYILEKDIKHIQSYFINFRPSVINSDVFANFIKNIKPLNNKYELIAQYETGLSKILYKKGFKGVAYFKEYAAKDKNPLNSSIMRINEDKFPFLKTTLLKSEYLSDKEILNQIDLINTFKTYDKDLIKNHIGRIRQKIKKPNFYRRIRYKVLAGCSEDMRLRVILAEKRLFLLLNTLFFNKLKKF